MDKSVQQGGHLFRVWDVVKHQPGDRAVFAPHPQHCVHPAFVQRTARGGAEGQVAAVSVPEGHALGQVLIAGQGQGLSFDHRDDTPVGDGEKAVAAQGVLGGEGKDGVGEGDEIEEKLASIDYEYDEGLNRFV